MNPQLFTFLVGEIRSRRVDAPQLERLLLSAVAAAWASGPTKTARASPQVATGRPAASASATTSATRSALAGVRPPGSPKSSRPTRTWPPRSMASAARPLPTTSPPTTPTIHGSGASPSSSR